MYHTQTVKCWSIIAAVLLFSTHILCASSYLDYENAKDLYELLLQKQLLQDNVGPSHQIARKAVRSPSLRLRFGKKSDPYVSAQSIMDRLHSMEETPEK